MSGFFGRLMPCSQRCLCCRRPLTSGETLLCWDCSIRLCALALPPEKRRAGRRVEGVTLAVAAFPYRGEAAALEQALKFHGARLASEPMSHIMALEAARFAPDALCHVPLHPKRLAKRGFDQARELTLSISEKTGLAALADALTRVRNTPSQVGLDREERAENMRGAFLARASLVEGKRLLLIDDVTTTGATAGACAEALLSAGAREIGLLTACRA